MSTSVIDYIFRELAVSYLGRNDLAHVNPDKEKEINNYPLPETRDDYDTEEVVGHKKIALDDSSYVSGNGDKGKLSGMPDQREIAKQQGYTGDICPECQSMTMVRNGTCLKCNTCGATTGCS